MKWITKTAKQIKQQNHRKTYFQERRERGKERGKGVMTTSYHVISRHVFIVLFFVFCSPSKNISSIYTSHTLLTSRLETYKAPVPGKLRDAEGCQRCYSRFSAGAILLDSGAGGPVPVSKSAKGATLDIKFEQGSSHPPPTPDDIHEPQLPHGLRGPVTTYSTR